MNRPEPPALPSGCHLVDTHCHLDMAEYQAELPEVIAAARRCGVTRIITIGIDLASSHRAVELAAQHENVYAAVGIHPHDADKADEDVYRQLRELAAAPKVVGFGEIGLDYAKKYSAQEAQLRVFARQLEIAKELRLPLIIHDREAHEDCLRLLREKGPFPRGGVMHCFSSGDSTLARQVLELGFYLSIPGIVTFPKAEMLRQVVRELPPDRLLLETDGPFLAPVPFRGKCCRPEHLLHTAATVAELQGLSLAELARQTTLNAEKLFSLPA